MAILTPPQREFLLAFFSSPLGTKFFLGGGTALAEFYLRHRISQDLDLFTLEQDLDFDFVNAEINKIANTLNFKTDHQVSSATFLQYIFQSKKGPLKVDVIKDVPVHFGKIKKMKPPPALKARGVSVLGSASFLPRQLAGREIKGVWVDSLENIAVGKLLAIFGRTDAKDFIDLYFLIKERGLNFKSLFKKAKKKDLGLNKFYLANMLAEIEKLKHFPKTLKPFSKDKLVDFYLKLSQKMLKEIKPKSGFAPIIVLIALAIFLSSPSPVLWW